MDRLELTQAALSAAGRGAEFHALQLQNLLFLIDREIAAECGGPFFAFEASRYGPFDGSVFDVAESLARVDRAAIHSTGPIWALSLTEEGFAAGEALRRDMPRSCRTYLRKAARWILASPFGAMLGGVCRRYPDIAANVGIPAHVLWGAAQAEWRRRHPVLAGAASLVGAFAPSRRDARATADDWRAVGEDLRFAIEAADLGSRA